MATQTTNYGLKKPAYSDTADIGVINSNMDVIDAKMKEIDDKITNETDPTVPAWAKEPNKPTYTAEEVGALPNNTPIPDPTSVVVDRLVSVGTHIADISVNGEKTELYAPTGGGGTSVTIDSELSTTSENPVQNKVITQALNGKGTYSKPTGGIPKTDLANEVQTSLGKADTALQEHQDISGKADKTEVTALFNSISDAWDSATAYTVGQYCIYNNALWKCLVANTNTEPTEGTHWTQTTIDEEITSVNSSLDNIYSTSEVKTKDVWIDGKPIYRKVISFDSNTINQNISFAHGISNLADFRCFDITHSVCIRKSDGLYISLGLPAGVASSDSGYAVTCSFFYDNDIVLQFGSATNGASGYVTLLYTKTSD